MEKEYEMRIKTALIKAKAGEFLRSCQYISNFILIEFNS